MLPGLPWLITTGYDVLFRKVKSTPSFELGWEFDNKLSWLVVGWQVRITGLSELHKRSGGWFASQITLTILWANKAISGPLNWDEGC